jgi:hypothetical protein
VLEPLAKLRIAIQGDCRVDERSEVGVRLNPTGANEGGASLEHQRLADIPANRRQKGELGQRSMKGSV